MPEEPITSTPAKTDTTETETSTKTELVSAKKTETSVEPTTEKSKIKATESELLTKSEKFLSALGYLSFFFLIPLLMKRDSKFCQYHAKQGLILTLILVVTSVVRVIPALNVLLGIVEIGVIAYSAFKASQGTKHVLPMISEMAKSDYMDF
jgi:uncharacterized membrane protein